MAKKKMYTYSPQPPIHLHFHWLTRSGTTSLFIQKKPPVHRRRRKSNLITPSRIFLRKKSSRASRDTRRLIFETSRGVLGRIKKKELGTDLFIELCFPVYSSYQTANTHSLFFVAFFLLRRSGEWNCLLLNWFCNFEFEDVSRRDLSHLLTATCCCRKASRDHSRTASAENVRGVVK